MSRKNQNQKANPKILALSSSTERPQPTRENKDIKTRQTKWIPFFKDSENIYPNKLAERYRRSTTLSSALNSLINISFGDEFIFEKDGEEIMLDEADKSFQDFVKFANVNKFLSLRDVYKSCLENYIIGGNNYLEVSIARVGNSVGANLFSHDFTKCRKSDRDCYISSFWRDIKNNANYNNSITPVDIIPLEGFDKKKYISHLMNKFPEYDYYGLPDYVAALFDADIEYYIDRHNLGRLKKGFVPKTTITQVGEPPDGMTPKQYADKLREKYTYQDNEYDTPESVVVNLVDSIESKPEIYEHSQEREGDFIDLEKSAYEGIVRGTRVFPSLAGIEVSGKLGGTNELINQYSLVLHRCRLDYQTPIITQINRALETIGFKEKIKGVRNSHPVSLHEFVSIKRILNINEQRMEIGYEPLEDEKIGESFLEKESEKIEQI